MNLFNIYDLHKCPNIDTQLPGSWTYCVFLDEEWAPPNRNMYGLGSGFCRASLADFFNSDGD